MATATRRRLRLAAIAALSLPLLELTAAARETPAPDFSLPSISGGALSLSHFRRRVVLLDFWASWCGPCRESIPFYAALYHQYRGRGLVVLGVSGDDDMASARQGAKALGADYPMVLDKDGRVADLYGVLGFPSVFLISRGGKILDHWFGYGPDERGPIEAELRAALKQAALKPKAGKAQGVGNDRDRTQAHGRGREHGA